MENDPLKNIFDNYQPQLRKDDFDFMTDLMRNMESVEIVKHQIDANLRRSRRAAFIAAIAGIIVGTLLSVLFSKFDGFTLSLKLADYNISSDMINWTFIAAMTVLSAVSSYKIAFVTAGLKK